ncbi:hypothetical protein HUG10_21400 (plasmid) [Halorarum halophilum]|uniref:Uncharacterized protein n=1 Tax=Halorarum halophilum TaxID=2743090 RepID=A0A7D5GEY8_9EURY|nr:hypothetical protein [Halobaculum halophilum]QLG30146.1 hypothetical protein HUG10_21400 [Halobaculum halophilum]
MSDPQYEIRVDDDRSWTTNSEFAEYDATHFVAGALLGGAEHVTIRQVEGFDDDE